MTVEWDEVNEVLKQTLPPKGVIGTAALAEYYRRQAALIQWFQSQDMDVGVGGTTMALLIGIMAGVKARDLSDLVTGMESIRDIMVTSSIMSLNRRNYNEKRKNNGR